MTLILAILAVAVVAIVFRMVLHHERQRQCRRFFSHHGARTPFYAEPHSWYEVTT